MSICHIDTIETTLVSGRAVAVHLECLPPEERPDGVFTANDLRALGLQALVASRTIEIPPDLALVGFDDISFASTASVPLATVRQPREELETGAVRLLMEGGDGRRQVRLHPSTVLRKGTLTRSIA